MLKIELDPATVNEFKRALNVYKDHTSKEHSYIVNRAAMNLAFRSAQFTEKTTKVKILAGMNNPKAVMASQILKAGGAIPAGFNQSFQKMLNKRFSSIAFIKASWLPAAKALAQVVKKGAQSISSFSFGRTKMGSGYVHIAQGIGNNCWAEIANTAINPKNPTSAAALEKIGRPAHEKAMKFVTADMMKFCNEVYDAEALKFNKK